MVDATEAYRSEWVNIDLVNNLKQRKGVIIGEGELQEGFKGRDQLVVPVEIDAKQYNWGLNKTSFDNLKKDWVGKTVMFQTMKINGNDSLIAHPLEFNTATEMEFSGPEIPA